MRCYLDFDSTLVDLTKGWLDWLKKEKFIKITTKNIVQWDWVPQTYGSHVNEYWQTKGIYDTIKPISGAVEFVTVLKSLYGTENVFLISNSHSNMIKEKEDYARRVFKISPSSFHHADSKWQFTSDGVLVDDAPHNVIAHVRNNLKPAILFNYRNRYGWSKLERPEKFVTICNCYGKCLETINNSKKYFSEEY